jgi:hypothetical protein
VVGTSPGSYPMAGFDISNAEYSNSIIRVLVGYFIKLVICLVNKF